MSVCVGPPKREKSVQRHQGVVDFLRSVGFSGSFFFDFNEGLQTLSSRGVEGQSGAVAGLTRRQEEAQGDPKTLADSHHHHNLVEPLKFWFRSLQFYRKC